MTENTESDPWEQPPEWVDLPDLPHWLARRFDLNNGGQDIIPRILDAIRRFELRYEIAGFLGPGEYSLPAGFGWEDGEVPGGRRVVVRDWDAVAPDWHTGTIGEGAGGQRYKIRVWWPRAERWAETPVRTLRSRRQNLRANDGISTSDTASGRQEAKSDQRSGRPTEKQRIQDTLRDMESEGHRLRDMSRTKLAKEVTRRGKPKDRDAGWNERTVSRHIADWLKENLNS